MLSLLSALAFPSLDHRNATVVNPSTPQPPLPPIPRYDRVTSPSRAIEPLQPVNREKWPALKVHDKSGVDKLRCGARQPVNISWVARMLIYKQALVPAETGLDKG